MMSVCGRNAVFFGHTYSRFHDSGVDSSHEHCEQSIYSMDTQRTSSDLTTTPSSNSNHNNNNNNNNNNNPPNPHHSHRRNMADHPLNRPFVGHHGLSGLPSMLDHWPSPPIAHTHHLNNNNNNNNNNNITTNNSNYNNNNNNTILGSCIQNQCNITEMDTTISDINKNNTNSPSMKNNTECPISPNDNMKNNIINNNNSNNNSNSDSPDMESPSARQNQVGTIVLHGVAIVSLIIDNKERLCLAQISNTLLKEYSYNEIHNRRVALGITCVQCTPVQLEILRRAGAMPVSSRRCGMITKREAERLVKSFLEDNDPPKLPEDFAFDVIHECGWGCRGLFEPARYNSSRAKCIKCIYCSMYFSPNKFIFHFHRTPGAKYNHPDAANFNSWRRHLKLNQANDKDEITFKWEDVKAMFNGGTRKRIGGSSSSSSSSSSTSPSSSLSSSKFASHLSSHHSSNSNNSSSNSVGSHLHSHHTPTANRSSSSYQYNPSLSDGPSNAKKAKTSSMVDAAGSNSFVPKPAPFSNPFTPYGWLGAGSQNKAAAAYPFMTMNSAQSMCFGFPPHLPNAATNNKEAIMDRMKSTPVGVGVGNAPAWMNRNPVLPFQLASMDLLWDKTFGFPSAAAVAALGGFRNGSYPNSIFPGTNTHVAMDINEHLSPPRANTPCMSPNSGIPQKMLSPGMHEIGEKGGTNRTSAFTRVVPSISPPSSASLSPQNSHPGINTPSRNGDEDDDDDVNDNSNMVPDSETMSMMDSSCSDAQCGKMENHASSIMSSHRDIDDTEEIDVEDHSEDKKQRLKCTNNSINNNNNNDNHNNNTSTPTHHQNHHHHNVCGTSSPSCHPTHANTGSLHSFNLHDVLPRSSVVSPSSNDVANRQLSLPASPRSDDGSGICDNRSNGRESVLSGVSESDRNSESIPRDIKKEDSPGDNLQAENEDMKDESENNKSSKGQLADEIRAKSFQEHMSKQLEMLRETLTTELEQERKIRYSLQEKLKQAHEALNSFSCGILNPNGEVVNHFKDGNSLPH